MSLRLRQVSIGEFVAAAGGEPRFRAKLKLSQTARADLRTDTVRQASLLCLADGDDAFFLFNWFVGGDVWSPETGDCTDPIWETVVLRATADVFEAIPTGPDSTYRLQWPGGLVQWAIVPVEPFTHLGEPMVFSVGRASVHITSYDGRACEFITELELPSATGEWRWERTASPSAFVLTRASETV